MLRFFKAVLFVCILWDASARRLQAPVDDPVDAPVDLYSLSRKVAALTEEVSVLRRALTSAGISVPTSLPIGASTTHVDAQLGNHHDELTATRQCTTDSIALLWEGGPLDAEHDAGKDWFFCTQVERTAGIDAVKIPQGLHVHHAGSSDVRSPFHDGLFAGSKDTAIKYGRLFSATSSGGMNVYEYLVDAGDVRLVLLTADNVRTLRDKVMDVTIDDIFGAGAFDGSDNFLANRYELFKTDMRWTVGQKTWVSDTGKPPLAPVRVSDEWIRGRHLAPLFYQAFDDTDEIRRDSRNAVDWVIMTALCSLFRSDPTLGHVHGWYGHNLRSSSDGKFADEIMLCKEGQHALRKVSESPVSAYAGYTGYK